MLMERTHTQQTEESVSATIRRLGPEITVSVILPCQDEEDVLPLLHQRLQAAALSWGTSFEVICIDDGSRDATWSILHEFHALDPRWKAIRLARNFGHQAALWAGLQRAKGDVLAVLDADLQDPPELLHDFLRKWSEGFDVVYGLRRKRKEGLLKRSAYSLYYRLLTLVSDCPVPLDAGDFCIMDRRVVTAMQHHTGRNLFVRGLRAWVGFRQTGISYERRSREAGTTKYSMRKLIELGMEGLISSWSRPLKLATYLGLLVTVSSAAGIFWALLPAESNPSATGSATALALAVLFLGGVQLICLGFLGEYVGRIHDAVRGRPLYTVMGEVGLPAEKSPAFSGQT